MAYSDGIAIDHAEMHRHPREWNDLYSGARERRFLVPWANREAFIAAIFTSPNNVYPYDSSGATAFQSFTEPFPAALTADPTYSDKAVYECALVTVKFATFSTTGAANLLVSEECHPWFEAHPIDHRNLTWASDDEPLLPGTGIGRMECGVNYSLTYHDALTLNAGILSNMNKANDAAFAMKTVALSFPAHTLLYKNFHLKIGAYTGGSTAIRVTYNFAAVSRLVDAAEWGWQAEWRADKAGNPAGGFDLVKLKGGNQIYRYAEGTFTF